MSDAATPTAPANEVVIDPAPVTSPAPVGSQAPDRPVNEDAIKGSEHRTQSRREAIKEAFDKAEKIQAREQQKTDKSERSTARAPEKKADVAKPDAAKAEEPQQPQPRNRGDHGHFASQKPAPETAPPPPALDEHAPYRDPPPRLSDKAKAEWAAAPESIRGDVHRMTQEFEGAYKRYRADSEAMNTIRPYHELATQHGTTLDRALSNYVGMEQRLRQDPLGGLEIIVNNLDLRSPDGRKITLRDVAHHIVSQTPEQLQMRQASNTQMAQSHQMAQMQQTIDGLVERDRQMQYQQAHVHARGFVDQFAESHPRFDELGELIRFYLPETKYDLAAAYDKAVKARDGEPSSSAHADQTRNPTSAQTRTADKSISGAPDAGVNGSRNPKKPVGRRDAISNAIRRVNGSL
jgi:hypothetical protein